MVFQLDMIFNYLYIQKPTELLETPKDYNTTT